MNIQPRLPGETRECLSPRVLSAVKNKVRSLAHQYDRSQSWIVSKILADAFGIKNEPSKQRHMHVVHPVRRRKRA